MSSDTNKYEIIKDALKISLEAIDNLDPEIILEFNQGRDAFRDGLSQRKNPYSSFTEENKLWLYGFRYQRDNHSDGN